MRAHILKTPAALVQLAQRSAPSDATVEFLHLSDKTKIRTARWLPGQSLPARGTVLICTGRGEFIEKYFEVAAELLARNFAVVAFDWRGQGLSSRALRNDRKGHVGDFREFEADLTAVCQTILLPECPKPFFALAHSMGGAVMLHHAKRTTCAFERVVLSAPMIVIDRLPFAGGLHPLCGFLTHVGFGTAFAPQGGRTAVLENGFDGNVLTSDPRRFADMMTISRAAPHLTVDAPTIGWLYAALNAMAPFAKPEFGSDFSMPILMIIPTGDRVVPVAAMERFGRSLKAGTIVTIPGARHEILMERDVLRNQFWAAFDAFVPGTALSRPISNLVSNASPGLNVDVHRS